VAVSDEVDTLYALPLDEFTATRNALAKKLGGRKRSGSSRSRRFRPGP